MKSDPQVSERVGERSKCPASVSPAMHPERMGNGMRLPFAWRSISPSQKFVFRCVVPKSTLLSSGLRPSAPSPVLARVHPQTDRLGCSSDYFDSKRLQASESCIPKSLQGKRKVQRSKFNDQSLIIVSPIPEAEGPTRVTLAKGNRDVSCCLGPPPATNASTTENHD